MSDISLHRVVDIHHVDAYIIGEVAVGELGMCIEMAVGVVKPTGIGGGVAPFHVHEVLKTHIVSCPEESERQPVTGRQAESQLQIGIIEIEGVVLILLRCLEEKVEI